MLNLKESIAKKWEEFASNPAEAMKRLSLKSAYGLLLAATVLPLAQAYANESNTTLLVLGGLLGNLGADLLSNFVQKVLDKRLSASEIEALASSLSERPCFAEKSPT